MNHEIVFEKINQALSESQFDALVISGADNFLYFTGTSLQHLYSQKNLPFFIFWKKGTDPVCVCPAIWESTFKKISSITTILAYPISADNIKLAGDKLAELIQNNTAAGNTVGLDLERLSFGVYQELKQKFADRKLVSVDKWLKELRMVKTSAELTLMKTIAAKTDHGITGASHHISTLAGKTEKYRSEDIRVHCMEREMDTTGYHCLSLVASGEHAKKMWPIAPKFGLGWHKSPTQGDVVRMEMRAVLDGYWSNLARLVIKGEYTTTLKEKYEQLVELRDIAIDNLKDGNTCDQVFQIVSKKAKQMGVDLLEGTPIGHSIGVTPREAPYIVDGDDTIISTDMIFIVDIGMRLESGEIYRMKDMVQVTADGTKILGWYKNWNQPYLSAYTF